MPSELRVDELRAEVEKMRRVPGIAFADGTFGRVPRIAGTGIEVFEVVLRVLHVLRVFAVKEGGEFAPRLVNLVR